MLVTPFALAAPQIGSDRCGPLMTVVVPWAILQGRRHAHMRAGANRVTTGQDPDPPRVPRWAVRLTRSSAALVDRLGDLLQVGLGLLGRRGRGQGAVEGGGQVLGDGQLGQLGPDQPPLTLGKAPAV